MVSAIAVQSQCDHSLDHCPDYCRNCVSDHCHDYSFDCDPSSDYSF
jgi:hypothetical protein